MTGALWLADGGITPAHANIGDYAKHTEQPQGTLELKHGLEGLEKVPEYPRIEGRSGQ